MPPPPPPPAAAPRARRCQFSTFDGFFHPIPKRLLANLLRDSTHGHPHIQCAPSYSSRSPSAAAGGVSTAVEEDDVTGNVPSLRMSLFCPQQRASSLDRSKSNARHRSPKKTETGSSSGHDSNSKSNQKRHHDDDDDNDDVAKYGRASPFAGTAVAHARASVSGIGTAESAIARVLSNASSSQSLLSTPSLSSVEPESNLSREPLKRGDGSSATTTQTPTSASGGTIASAQSSSSEGDLLFDQPHVQTLLQLLQMCCVEHKTEMEMFTIKHVWPETVLFRQGDSSDTMYVLLSGQLAARQVARDGTCRSLILFEGQSFCEVALLGLRFHIATVESISHCYLLAIPRTVFNDAAIPRLSGRLGPCDVERLTRRNFSSSEAGGSDASSPKVEIQEMEPDEIAKALRRQLVNYRVWSTLQQLQFIEHVAHDAQMSLASYFEIRQYPAGEIVRARGTPSREFFLVLTGTLVTNPSNTDDAEHDGIPLTGYDLSMERSMRTHPSSPYFKESLPQYGPVESNMKNCFGELSFFHDFVVNRDVMAKDACTVAVLTYDAYRRAVEVQPSIKPNLFRKLADLTVLECIYTIPGLRALPAEVVDGMLDHLDFVEVPSGNTLIETGEPVRQVSILCHGRAQLWQEGHAAGLLGIWSWIGLDEARQGQPASHTVTAATQLLIYTISADVLRATEASTPDLTPVLDYLHYTTTRDGLCPQSEFEGIGECSCGGLRPNKVVAEEAAGAADSQCTLPSVPAAVVEGSSITPDLPTPENGDGEAHESRPNCSAEERFNIDQTLHDNSHAREDVQSEVGWVDLDLLLENTKLKSVDQPSVSHGLYFYKDPDGYVFGGCTVLAG
eukprot:INCI15031.4.p1 GENE.INCI15031.4~~INCI15031.4.p1  ORF type:complete len:872 (-),score=138.08 INCI15031.4:80-2617(-)